MTNIFYNPILDTDSYKLSQFVQYPAGMTNLNSYIEARKGGKFDEVVFFGLQAFLKTAFDTKITQAMVDQAMSIAEAHGEPFNYDGWLRIVTEFDGNMPLVIEALPEGAVVPCGTPLVQVRATHPDFGWLVTTQETRLLRAIWYASTVATYSRAVKKVLDAYLYQTCDTPDAILPFMLHDFGARGVSSYEGSLIGGAAHLINFMGTDTIATLSFIQSVYNTHNMPGFSVPAAEHSTITSWGVSGEADAYANMLDQFGGGNIVSIVSDSYDLFNAVDNIYGGVLKDRILAMNARLVVRPDSGDPATIVLATVERLGVAFGYRVNESGYRVLDDKVRVLQGDGVNLESIEEILNALVDAGWSVENVVFGMGGALLQQQNRDTLRFAMKASAIQMQGKDWFDVYKKPATDPTKASKAGIQSVIYHDLSGEIVTMRRDEYEKGNPEHWEDGDDLLVPVWKDGELLIEHTFEEIRERAKL